MIKAGDDGGGSSGATPIADASLNPVTHPAWGVAEKQAFHGSSLSEVLGNSATQFQANQVRARAVGPEVLSAIRARAR